MTKVQVAWEGLRELLLHDDCLVLPSPSKEEGTAANDDEEQQEPQASEGPGQEGGVMIKYEAFLESFAVQYGRHAASGGAGRRVFDALYANRKQVCFFCVCVLGGGEWEGPASSDRTPNV